MMSKSSLNRRSGTAFNYRRIWNWRAYTLSKSSKSLWERLLFQDRGILPTRRLFIAFFVFSCFIGLLSFFGIPWMVIFLLNMLFILGSLGDLFFSPRKRELAFKRTLPEEMERGIADTVKVTVQHTSSQDCDFRILAHIPYR